MTPENTSERRVIKLHTHLEGKHILMVEDYSVYDNEYLESLIKLNRLRVTWKPSIVEPLPLDEFDGYIIHPESNKMWKQKIQTLIDGGKPLILTKGVRAHQEYLSMMERYRKMNIPIVQRDMLPNSFFDQLLDALEAAFAALPTSKS